MRVDGVIHEPIKIEVLYASAHNVVALVEGVLYVKNDGEFMHPVSIPVPDGDVFLSFETIKQMRCREHGEYNGVSRHFLLPFDQFATAVTGSLRDDFDRRSDFSDEADTIFDVVFDVFGTELREAQLAALAFARSYETAVFHEEKHRFLNGECTADEFAEWFDAKVQVLDIDEIWDLIKIELGGEEEENG